MPAEAPFWKTKSLDEMSDAEWESLCDGCGRCCLNKLEEWDTGRIFWTNVACQLLDAHTCRCSDYPNRHATVPDCIRLDPHEVRTLGWLPPSCAYRMIDEGRDLAWWHPLVSGDPDTVHTAGVSVRGRFISELTVSIDDLEDHIDPFAGRKPKAGLAARRRLRPNRIEPA